MDITIFKDKLINKRNIILFAIVIILIIIALIMFFILKNREKEKLMPVEFSSNDSSISISVANEYEFSTVSDDSYKLVLKSAVTGSAIYFSEVSNTNVRDTLKLVEADKNDYISKFSNISQVSDVSETTINGSTAYTYNFHYKDTMLVDVYWIVKDSKFIVIDFNIDTTNLDLSSHIGEILNSLKIN